LDNLTHSLFGLTLARTPLGRAGKGATVALLLASNAPDIDIVAASGGAMKYLEWHRGPTHGPLGVVGLGLATAAVAWVVRRAWQARTARSPADPDAGADASFATLCAVSMVGVLCHVLMDLPTSYGTRPFSPFDWHWYAVDWMPIIDVYLWLVLGIAVIAGSRWRRERVALVALGLMAVDYTARAALHERALANAASFNADGLHAPCVSAPTLVAHSGPANLPLIGGDECVEAAALPTFFSPFTWRSIRRYPHRYELSDRNIFGEHAATHSTALMSDDGPGVERAAASRAGRVYFDFARFAVAQVSAATGPFTRVRLFDARFVMMPLASGDGATNARLSVTITFDESGRTVDERFGN